MASNASKHDSKLTESKEAQLKGYEKKVKDSITSMLENFTELIKEAKVSQQQAGWLPFIEIQVGAFAS